MDPTEYERLSFNALIESEKEKKEFRKLIPSLKKTNYELKKENDEKGKENFNLKKNISIK